MPGCQRCSRSLTAAHGLWAVRSLTQRHMGRSQFADSGTWAADSDVSGPCAAVQRCSRSLTAAHGPLTAPQPMWGVTSLNGPCAFVTQRAFFMTVPIAKRGYGSANQY
nr:hypothetical protein Iba_chr02bCG8990 [Ipomoea batatas]